MLGIQCNEFAFLLHMFGEIKMNMTTVKSVASIMLIICSIFFLIQSTAAISTYEYTELKTEKTVLYGDANSDGKVTTGDVVYILRYIVDIGKMDAAQFTNADINNDVRIDTADAVILMKYYSGYIPELPYADDFAIDTNLKFYNESFPQNGARLSYNMPYSLKGTVLSAKPMQSVTLEITDIASKEIEISKTLHFSSNENIYTYDTEKGEMAIDKYVKFSMLKPGMKKLKLNCFNTSGGGCVYASTFNVGVTYNEIADYVYNLRRELSESDAKNVLKLLNTLDYNNDVGAKVLAEGMTRLGTAYALMDCSKFVQLTIKAAINFDLPRKSVEQAYFCTENGFDIAQKNKKSGDLLFMSKTGCDCGRYHEIHHSALYIGRVDGVDYLLESTGTLGGVIIRRQWGLSSGKWTVDSMARLWD